MHILSHSGNFRVAKADLADAEFLGDYAAFAVDNKTFCEEALSHAVANNVAKLAKLLAPILKEHGGDIGAFFDRAMTILDRTGIARALLPYCDISPDGILSLVIKHAPEPAKVGVLLSKPCSPARDADEFFAILRSAAKSFSWDPGAQVTADKLVATLLGPSTLAGSTDKDLSERVVSLLIGPSFVIADAVLRVGIKVPPRSIGIRSLCAESHSTAGVAYAVGRNLVDLSNPEDLFFVVKSTRSLEALRALLQAGHSPACVDDLGNTPLHYACSSVHRSESVDALLQAGSGALLPNGDGITPIDLAVQCIGDRRGIYKAAIETTALEETLLSHGYDLRDRLHEVRMVHIRDSQKAFAAKRSRWFWGMTFPELRSSYLTLSSDAASANDEEIARFLIGANVFVEHGISLAAEWRDEIISLVPDRIERIREMIKDASAGVADVEGRSSGVAAPRGRHAGP